MGFSAVNGLNFNDQQLAGGGLVPSASVSVVQAWIAGQAIWGPGAFQTEVASASTYIETVAPYQATAQLVSYGAGSSIPDGGSWTVTFPDGQVLTLLPGDQILPANWTGPGVGIQDLYANTGTTYTWTNNVYNQWGVGITVDTSNLLMQGGSTPWDGSVSAGGTDGSQEVDILTLTLNNAGGLLATAPQGVPGAILNFNGNSSASTIENAINTAFGAGTVSVTGGGGSPATITWLYTGPLSGTSGGMQLWGPISRPRIDQFQIQASSGNTTISDGTNSFVMTMADFNTGPGLVQSAFASYYGRPLVTSVNPYTYSMQMQYGVSGAAWSVAPQSGLYDGNDLTAQNALIRFVITATGGGWDYQWNNAPSSFVATIAQGLIPYNQDPNAGFPGYSYFAAQTAAEPITDTPVTEYESLYITPGVSCNSGATGSIVGAVNTITLSYQGDIVTASGGITVNGASLT